MRTFSDKNIIRATFSDITEVKELLNNTYRGKNSKQGWTTEADLISGDIRADENMVRELMNKPGSVFLIYKNEQGIINGCVNLQKQDTRIYLGMLAVSPLLQGGGIGKKLLQAAEDYALSINCKTIYMSVISVRTELVDWYMRHGYTDTGERKPFAEDGLTGRHVQPLEFMMLEKSI